MTKQKTVTLLLLLLLSITFCAIQAHAQNQENIDETIESVEDEIGTATIEEASSIWGLVGQAGGIRYPLFGILIVGIFLISLRSYELYTDNKIQSELQETSFRHMSLNEISSKISIQQDYMLSKIMAKLLNVFQTNKNADYLHDEISNYNSIQQDNYNTFKNRIDFLSDTAGALGLLGTVWGMFIVFSSGTLEREVILVGMGLALMSTLLGLVVSIILNFCSTLSEGYFTKHLENVTSKADELRFRLIELSESPSILPKAPASNNNNYPNVKTQGPKNDHVAKAATGKPKEITKAPEINEPSRIEVKTNINKEIRIGDSIDNIQVYIHGSLNKPVKGAELDILLEGKGYINDDAGKTTLKTDTNGIVTFTWKPENKPGEKRLLIKCSDEKYKNVKTILKTFAKAGTPENMKLLNNHQAGLTGNALGKPVTISVTDSQGNPVEGVKVLMKVTMGDGKFDNGKKETTTKTDEEGKAFIDFTLGSEPGFNAIDISLVDFGITKSFQAVGQEVTV